MGVYVVENLSRVFLSEWPLLHLWVMGVYIVWVKGKKVTLKNPPGRMFREYLAERPYSQDTRENNSLAQLFSFQSCAPYMPFSREPFSRTSHELVAKCTDLQLSLSLHQLNTKPNTIKSHKIQGTKLKQLQHFLSWNKANIKHSCKSQLYRIPLAGRTHVKIHGEDTLFHIPPLSFHHGAQTCRCVNLTS